MVDFNKVDDEAVNKLGGLWIFSFELYYEGCELFESFEAGLLSLIPRIIGGADNSYYLSVSANYYA